MTQQPNDPFAQWCRTIKSDRHGYPTDPNRSPDPEGQVILSRRFIDEWTPRIAEADAALARAIEAREWAKGSLNTEWKVKAAQAKVEATSYAVKPTIRAAVREHAGILKMAAEHGYQPDS